MSREDTEKIIAACPNIEWKLIIALARYGGLADAERNPAAAMERRGLWDQSKLLVHSPKDRASHRRRKPLCPAVPRD